jgi:hypothetical protein
MYGLRHSRICLQMRNMCGCVHLLEETETLSVNLVPHPDQLKHLCICVCVCLNVNCEILVRVLFNICTHISAHCLHVYMG